MSCFDPFPSLVRSGGCGAVVPISSRTRGQGARGEEGGACQRNDTDFQLKRFIVPEKGGFRRVEGACETKTRQNSGSFPYSFVVISIVDDPEPMPKNKVAGETRHVMLSSR